MEMTMKIESRVLDTGVTLGVISTDKFKNNYFSLNFLLPLTEKNISECSVLSNVLLRGTKSYPTFSAMSKRVGMIYDPSLDVSATKTASALVFKIGAYFLGNEYLPKGESMDVFGEVTSLMTEILKNPVTENGALSSAYTESEKKRQIDRIKAKINNKDGYALSRCSSLMLGDVPAALEAAGTEEAVNSVTPESLFEMLRFILTSCPVLAVFAGNFTKKAEKTVNNFISSLFAERRGSEVLPFPTLIKPELDYDIKNISEDISATQGRMVMGFSMPDYGEKTAPTELFNEIFGGSPVSRLFANVRERLQLCYYCASAQNHSLNVMYVRSGINRENVETARGEILRQLDLLKNPEEISDEELTAAKLGIISTYNATRDSLVRYAMWYVNRSIVSRHTDVERCIEEVKAVDKAAISEVARSASLKINYFLNGIDS